MDQHPKSLVEAADTMEMQDKTKEPRRRGRRKGTSADDEEEARNVVSSAGEDKPAKKIRQKFEKKEHIKLVQSWLEHSLTSPLNTTKTSEFWDTAPMQLTVSPSTSKVAMALLAKKNNLSSFVQRENDRALKEDLEQPVKKLDDLADCFLQATAWVVWERNRMVMAACTAEDEWKAMEEASGP